MWVLPSSFSQSELSYAFLLKSGIHLVTQRCSKDLIPVKTYHHIPENPRSKDPVFGKKLFTNKVGRDLRGGVGTFEV